MDGYCCVRINLFFSYPIFYINYFFFFIVSTVVVFFVFVFVFLFLLSFTFSLFLFFLSLLFFTFMSISPMPFPLIFGLLSKRCLPGNNFVVWYLNLQNGLFSDKKDVSEDERVSFLSFFFFCLLSSSNFCTFFYLVPIQHHCW